MANDRLRAAANEAGLQIEDLAEIAGVDTKTVERWLAGRTPYSRYRSKLARALDHPEHELWPELKRKPDDDRAEIISAFAHANDPRAPDWHKLMADASERIELLDYTLLDVIQTPGVVELLAAKGAADCEIRILITDEDSLLLSLAAQELGQDGDFLGHPDLRREVQLARAHLEPILAQPGIEVREFLANRFNSILRFDDQMLVTLKLWGTPTSRAPTLHLRRGGDHGLFDQFAGHFQRIWLETSQAAEPDPDRYPPPAQDPEHYRPWTQERHERESEQSRAEGPDRRAGRPLQEVREELRRKLQQQP